ncbi:helix-turn-helix domain-containing protein [Mesobacillus jeotgali]|uniref:hypothetical protein n=1 Tax=Mesobacillus jeotgali TaxID=129985 RepID=UPI000C85B392|nr:hypothetical protein [Mesobacillus jeotgali]
MIELKYVKENRPFQRFLDKHYTGKLVPVDRYLNGKATIKFFCFGCYQEFYAKPGYLINIESQRHRCNGKYESLSQPQLATISKPKMSDADKDLIISLHKQGFSMGKIAKQIGVSKDVVKYQIRKKKGKAK